MWNEPYLETCCRSALHRLCLAEPAGRPEGLRDESCLRRLKIKGLACSSADGRYHLTPEGRARHASEVLKEVR